MRPSIPFDTHAYVKRLTSAGVWIHDLMESEWQMLRYSQDDKAQVRNAIEESYRQLERRLSIKLGAMIVAAIFITAALVNLL